MKYGGQSRTWSQRLRINGKPASIGLGSYPVVTLAEARRVALENRRALSMGHDPRRSIPTLAQSSERVLAVHSANWRDSGRTEKIWRAAMRDYVMPQLGRKRVDQITTADVMSVLLPHWSAKRETMRRIKQRLSRIFRWSIAQGYRTDDPAGTALDAALPRNGGKTQHFAALPHGEVAAAVAAVRKSGAWPGTKAAFEFLVLTACRSGRGPAGDVGRSQPRIRYLDSPGGSCKDTARAQSASGTASRHHTGRDAAAYGRRRADLSVDHRQGAFRRDVIEAGP